MQKMPPAPRPPHRIYSMIHDLARDFAHAQAIQVALPYTLPCTPRRRQAEGCFFAASGRLGRGGGAPAGITALWSLWHWQPPRLAA
jgi:hypothetical protein